MCACAAESFLFRTVRSGEPQVLLLLSAPIAITEGLTCSASPAPPLPSPLLMSSQSAFPSALHPCLPPSPLMGPSVGGSRGKAGMGDVSGPRWVRGPQDGEVPTLTEPRCHLDDPHVPNLGPPPEWNVIWFRLPMLVFKCVKSTSCYSALPRPLVP